MFREYGQEGEEEAAALFTAVLEVLGGAGAEACGGDAQRVGGHGVADAAGRAIGQGWLPALSALMIDCAPLEFPGEIKFTWRPPCFVGACR